jgi:hypothetical protein
MSIVSDKYDISMHKYINLKMCIENGKHYSYRIETH